MAKDDTTSGGLFSKMVKFVRSPGTQWNDLDDPSSAKDGAMSKQALKEMIERKRRNDFVRKREFDMLRKLRRREAIGADDGSEAAARPSFFQSSMPSRPDDRARTLKKIDEIEAQMSMQWWKTKHGTGGTSSIGPGSDFSASEVGARQPPSRPVAQPASFAHSLAYARTAADDLQNSIARSAARVAQSSAPVVTARVTPAPSDNPAAYGAPAPAPVPSLAGRAAPPSIPVPTLSSVGGFAAAKPEDNSLDFTADIAPASQPVIKSVVVPAAQPVVEQTPAKVAAPPKVAGMMSGLAASYEGAGAMSGFSASKLFALEVDEVQHDPELEEAAIRFANGDDSGAEAGLLEAVSVRGSRHQHEETWLTLFDLYRATNQYSRFESLAIDFAGKFNRSSPNWFSIPDMVSKMTGLEPAAPAGLRKADWKSPPVFGIQSLAALTAAVAKAPMPWTLDWEAIQSIDDNAVAPLSKLLISWAGQNVQLRIAHPHQLERVLRDGTPSGVQSVDQERWNLLMAYMRVSHRPDEFELAALDFCVTYEVSPPSWEPARCEFKVLDDEGNTGLGQTIVGDAVLDSIVSEMHTETGSSTLTAQLASVELSGQIMGEPGPVLDKLEARLTGADMMIISCAKLVRVDFSAAGSLLNWVSARQTEGRIVQFTDVHRLVAAFFHVIGISEHAKVTTRTD